MSNYNAQQLETLRRRAREVEAVRAARKASAAQSFAARQTALDEDREQQLRDAYISQQQALTQLPDRLARMGINGGLAESSLLQLNRDYGNRRANINSTYAKYSRELMAEKAEAEAKAAQQAAAAAAAAAVAAARQTTGQPSSQTGSQNKEEDKKKPTRPGNGPGNTSLVGHTSLIM